MLNGQAGRVNALLERRLGQLEARWKQHLRNRRLSESEKKISKLSDDQQIARFKETMGEPNQYSQYDQMSEEELIRNFGWRNRPKQTESYYGNR